MPIPSYILPSAPAYTEDSVYALIPTPSTPIYTPDAISFTRGSDATRTDSNGLIQRVPWNFLEYTTTFLGWTQNGFISGGHTDPFGGNNARLYQFSSATDRIALQIPITAGVTYTLSAWIKGVDLTDFRMLLGTNQQVNVYPQIVNGEWIRVSATVTATTTGNYQQSPARANSSNVQSFYIYGPQLVEGSSAQTYFPTTDRLNVPRIDFSQGSCPALLLEPQRTNLITQSEDLTNADWIKAQATVSGNNTTAPDGNNTADKLIINNGSSGGYAYQAKSTTIATIYTGSFYVKAGGVSFTKFQTNISGIYQSAVVNLSTGAITNSTFATTPTATSVGNGWYRVSYTVTSGGSNVVMYIDGGCTSIGGTFTGNGTDGIFLWGAQFEADAYPTTYIPTTTTSVTRLADTATRTGISSVIGQTEGVIFADVYLNSRSSFTYLAIAPNLSSATTYIGIGFTATNFQFEVVNSGIQSAITFVNSSTGRFKIAAAYKQNDFAFYVNGTQIGTDTSGTVPTCSELGLAAYSQSASVYYNQVALFQTRLTNTQLASLTTL